MRAVTAFAARSARRSAAQRVGMQALVVEPDGFFMAHTAGRFGGRLIRNSQGRIRRSAAAVFAVTVITMREISSLFELSMYRLLEFLFDFGVTIQAGFLEIFRLFIFGVHSMRTVTAGTGRETFLALFLQSSVNTHVIALVPRGTSTAGGMHPVVTLFAGSINTFGGQSCSGTGALNIVRTMTGCALQNAFVSAGCDLRRGVLVTSRALHGLQIFVMRKVIEPFEVTVAIHTRQRSVFGLCQGVGRDAKRQNRSVLVGLGERLVRVAIHAGRIVTRVHGNGAT